MTGDAAETSRSEGLNAPMTLERVGLVWLLFLLICLGLGYPIFNRYDPTKLEGASDVGVYRDIVVGRKPQRAGNDSGAYARLAQSGNYSNALGNTARALFSIAGPILSLSGAIFLAGPTRAAEPRGRDGMRGAEEHTPC